MTNLGFGIARVELESDAEDSTPEPNDISGSDSNDNSQKPRKWVIFVPNVIPGELVRVRIYRNFNSYSDADLVEILEPSPDRIDPKCSLAGICGGCQYQHITIDRQRSMKTMQVQELFERVGGLKADEFPKVLDTLGTDEVFGYRSKITPHYDAPLRTKRRRTPDEIAKDATKEYEIGSIGFKEKNSRRLVDVPYCHIATPAINTALEKVRDETRAKAIAGKLKKPSKGATLLLRDAGGIVETNHTAYVNTNVGDLVFRFQAGNFFQVCVNIILGDLCFSFL